METTNAGRRGARRAVEDTTVARPLARPVRAGDVIADKYRLVSSLGRGGMGRIFLADHLLLDTTVALKFMHPHLARDPVSVARFAREARAAATLKSEHAARILDVDERSCGEPYIVMEHLDGHSLDAVRKSGQGLPIADAVRYVIQACDALDEAHSRGIIHRDVKPANLFLTKGKSGESVVKVLDFGLAKSNDSQDPVQSGVMRALGTPSYMSPEQIGAGPEVDGRTDVWSLGATLYELLTAQATFDAPSAVLVFARILRTSPTPVQTLRPDVPDALAAIIDRCLARDAGERFPSMGHLARALEEVAVTSSAGPEAPARREPTPRQTMLAALAGPALLALLAVLMLAWTDGSSAPAAAPSRSVLVHVAVKSGDITRAKDPGPRGALSVRCAKNPRNLTCGNVARN